MTNNRIAVAATSTLIETHLQSVAKVWIKVDTADMESYKINKLANNLVNCVWNLLHFNDKQSNGASTSNLQSVAI